MASIVIIVLTLSGNWREFDEVNAPPSGRVYSFRARIGLRRG